MADVSVMKVLYAIGRASEELFGAACEELGKDSLSAVELRTVVRNAIEDAGPHSYNFRKFWKPLTDQQKQEALEMAIPDGEYPAVWESS